MTGKQPIWVAVIAGASAAVLLAAHILLPIEAGWAANRYLHYGWQAIVLLATAGGVVWLMWPRPRARRRDFDRAAARRRVMGVAGVIMAAVFLIIIGELHREARSRGLLEKAAIPDLQVIGKALAAYAADHAGARPKTVDELVPKYLDADRLYYAYRDGPVRVAPPAVEAKAAGPPGADQSGPAAEGTSGATQAGPVAAAPPGPLSPPPSYAVVTEAPGTAGIKKSPTAVTAFLRSGNAWAPLTAVVEENGQCRVVSEDNIKAFERQLEAK